MQQFCCFLFSQATSLFTGNFIYCHYITIYITNFLQDMYVEYIFLFVNFRMLLSTYLLSIEFFNMVKQWPLTDLKHEIGI